jgi:hypothetical protein
MASIGIISQVSGADNRLGTRDETARTGRFRCCSLYPEEIMLRRPEARRPGGTGLWFFSGADLEQGIDRAVVEKAGEQRDQADQPDPADSAVQEEHQAEQGKSQNNPDPFVYDAYVFFHVNDILSLIKKQSHRRDRKSPRILNLYSISTMYHNS